MKRCPRCQTNYTDEVRWCPADGTPTEDLAPVSPAALAAAAIADIPEGSPTIRDMKAVQETDAPPDTLPPPGPQTILGTPDVRGPAEVPVIPQRGPALPPALAEIAASIPGPAIVQPLASQSDSSRSKTVMGAPAPRLPAQPTPAPPIAQQLAVAGPQVPKPGAVTAGWDIPDLPATPTTVPGAQVPPISSPLMSTFMGTTSEPPRTPVGSPTTPAKLAATTGPVGNTFMGAPSPVPRAPAAPTGQPASATTPGMAAHVPGPVTAGWDIPDAPSSSIPGMQAQTLPPTPSTVPGAPVPPISSPLMSTFMGTTSEPPRTPVGSPTTPAKLAATTGPVGNTFMGAASPVPRAPASPTGPQAPGTTPGPVTAGWDIPDAPASSIPGMQAQQGPHIPKPGAITAGWDIPDAPASSIPGMQAAPTVQAPQGPHIPKPGAVTAGWDIPDVPASSTTPGMQAQSSSAPAAASQPVAPHAHTPGPVSLGWDVPEQPAGASLTGVVAEPASSPVAALAALSQGAPKIDRAQSTLPGFAPPAEIMRAIQEQRAKTAALRVPQPMETPVVSPEAFVPSASTTSTPATAEPQQGTVPSFSPPPPTAPAPPLEGAAVKPPSASMLEAPAYPPQGQPPSARAASETAEALRAAKGNKTLWIILAVVSVLVIGAVIAIFATR